MKFEEILQTYVDGTQTGDENKLRAAIGMLSVDRMQELSLSIQALHQQIPITISELRQTISRNTEKMIESNEKLSKSNESYAKWMKWLTFGLVFVSVVQLIIVFIK